MSEIITRILHVYNNVNEIAQGMVRGYRSNFDAIKYSVHPFKILHDAIYIKIKNYIYTYIVQYLYALLFDILHTIYSCKQWSCTLWNCHIYIILYLEIILHAIDKACNVELTLFSHKLFLNC